MVARFKKHRVLLGLVFVAGIFAFVIYLKMVGKVPDLSMIKMYRIDFEATLMKNFAVGALIYIALYTGIVALSLPFATPLTLLAGFIFGNLYGTVIVVVAASTGATLSVLINRYFFRDFVEYKFGKKLKQLNSELSGHGFRDILLLRLAPVVPFSLINILSAVTSVRVRDFFLATLIGTLPFTFIYVNAGTQLADINSASDILSLQTLVGISLIVLSVIIPIFIRRRRGSAPPIEIPK